MADVLKLPVGIERQLLNQWDMVKMEKYNFSIARFVSART